MDEMKLVTRRGLEDGSDALAVVGLGYVGMPIAVAFSKRVKRVIGYDVSEQKVRLYREGKDPTREVGDDGIASCGVEFTSDPSRLREAGFIIVAVPTPVGDDHAPDLGPLRGASRAVGENLAEGAVVVYESTVYPGATEEVCVPILESESGLSCGRGFKVGYSPERINPGDRAHRLDTVTKVVSGMDRETLELVADVYSMVAASGVYRAESIRVAEAAKVIENSQRDINIAFMNELSIIFHRMGIDTRQVLQAARTKWNFLGFEPGLVGGHCIGVDPYYLTYRAEREGYHSQVILSGRRVNDEMGRYVAQSLVKCLVRSGLPVAGARVVVLGFTFKENCPDTRNTRVADVVRELGEYDIRPCVVDPIADAGEARSLYGVEIRPESEARDADAVIVAVAHDSFRGYGEDDVGRMFNASNAKRVLLDVKGIFDKDAYEGAGYCYWRL